MGNSKNDQEKTFKLVQWQICVGSLYKWCLHEDPAADVSVAGRGGV